MSKEILEKIDQAITIQKTDRENILLIFETFKAALDAMKNLSESVNNRISRIIIPIDKNFIEIDERLKKLEN